MTREEAINKVRQMSLPKETMDILEALAPELAMSEDERIREGLVNFILYKAGHLLDEETEHKFIAYLEKQKEEKPEQYDIDVLEKHITKDSISELAHTVIVRNGWEIVGQEPEYYQHFDPDC